MASPNVAMHKGGLAEQPSLPFLIVVPWNWRSIRGPSRSILVRQIYSDIASDSYCFEQAFSEDGGRTWETNWVMTFTRNKAR
jgi:hypothetical protein